MGRFKGTYITSTYDTNKRFPIDSRMLVGFREDLIRPDVWHAGTQEIGNALFNGLITAVNSDGVNNGVYYLLDRTAITEENYNAYLAAVEAGEDIESYFTMWCKLAELSEISDLSNTLNAIESQLKEEVETLKAQIATKAAIVTLARLVDLPTIGSPNTVYFIEDKHKACVWNGTNYVWSSPDSADYNEITRISGGDASNVL